VDPAIGTRLQLRSHGIAVVLATGRRLSDLTKVGGDLECFNAIVAENGAVLTSRKASATR
jgi:hydroxymethylpyrimidine pyrophosphatase-like HAD family hydrolase